MLVHKFGGSSVANAQRIASVAEVVVGNSRPAAVVTSAMAGVTDTLIALAEAAQSRNDERRQTLFAEICRKHLAVAEAVAHETKQNALIDSLNELLYELDRLVHGVQLLQELTPRSLDLILSFGERLAVRLLAAAIERLGVASRAFDSREIIRTDERFGQASVDMETSARLTREKLLPLCDREIPVVTGFIGQTTNGLTTTLGRGGSDYSATLVGAFCNADEIWIWTDVDGVMTADPNVVPEARLLESITYREAAEMAYFGSKILHPSTMIPAVQTEIPIRIRNSFRPERMGTLIAKRSAQRFEGVKTVTSISDMALVTVEGKGMIGVPGVVGRVFTATARAGVNVFMISQSSSEQNISFLVRRSDGEKAKKELEQEFTLELQRQRIDRVDVHAPVGILAIIGEGMKGTPGIAQRVFTALGRGRINVLAIAQGSSELNVSIVVEQADLHRAVGVTHTRFGLTNQTHVFLLGKGLIGRTLIKQLLAGRERLQHNHGLSLNVIGVSGQSELLLEPKGIDDDRLRRIVDGASLLELGGQARPSDEEILQRIAATNLLDVAIVDVTASETGEFHRQAIKHGFHIVTANKKTLSGKLELFQTLRAEAFAQGVGYHFETTFGGGLPVLFTLQDLLATRDGIIRINGCFSGTLGFICAGLQKGGRFSEIVREAKALGYTEPDPRDDLSGLDVARKALIIAREIGQLIEMEDIRLEPMIPKEFLALPSVDEFMRRLPELDALFAEKVAQASADGKVLRYMAEVSPESVAVGLRAVELSSAEGQLSGPENILIYQTERYRENPLVIRGPGAGAEVTAAGVYSDLLKVARHV